MNHARLLVILILMPLALILLVYKQSQPFMRGKNHSTEQTVEIAPGPFITWWDNGQMLLEINNKHNEDGIPVKDGLTTRWYRNGQKKEEGNYKNGKLISGKFWNSKGEPVANTQPKPEGVNKKELEEREGIIYLKGSDTPYTGNP